MAFIKNIKEPYQAPTHLEPQVREKQQELLQKQAICDELIERLEVLVRAQVKHELARHRSRMNYYQAQSRLAKARLYDATLQDLSKAKQRAQKTSAAESK